MAKNSGNASEATPRLHDPVTTDTAVSILRTLIASSAAEERTFDSEEGDSDAVGAKADGSAGRMTAWNAAAKSAPLSRAEVEALQPDIVLVEGRDSHAAQVQRNEPYVVDSRCVDGDRNIEEDDALEILVDGLRTGRLIAVFLIDMETVTIPAAYWATDDSRATARQGYRLKRLGDGPGAKLVQHHALVSKIDVYSLMGTTKPRNRGGRPAEYDWEGIMFEIWAYATDHGIPKTQAQFFRDVALHFGNRAPRSDTNLKERTDRVFKKIVLIKRSTDNPKNLKSSRV